MAGRTATIIGGGIAGPVAAIALKRAGIDATIYEAYDGRADGVGAILSLAPNGIDALRAIGIDATTIGEPVDDMALASPDGTPLVTMPGLAGLPPSRIVRRSDLYRLLRDEAANADVRFVYGKQLTGIDETSESIVARFADNDWACCDLLVGADGIRSTVRTLIDPMAPGPRYVGHVGFGGIAIGSGFQCKPRTMYFANGKHGFLGYWMQPDGSVAWFVNLPHPAALTIAQARLTSNDEWLRRLRDVFAGEIPGEALIEHTTPESFIAIGAGEIMPRVPTWHRGRAVLVGDSAHAPSSSSGQGASLAIESAVELTRCIRDTVDLETAFTTYERLRRPRVEKVAAFGARNNDRKVAGPIAKAVMRTIMPLMMKTVLKPEKMFGWMHGYHIDFQSPPHTSQ